MGLHDAPVARLLGVELRLLAIRGMGRQDELTAGPRRHRLLFMADDAHSHSLDGAP